MKSASNITQHHTNSNISHSKDDACEDYLSTKPSELLKALLAGNGLLNNEEAAAYIGVSPGTLDVWRSTKRYSLAYIKVGRLVKYRKEALDDFLATQTVVA
jgi:excisionase family DNA binding protein